MFVARILEMNKLRRSGANLPLLRSLFIYDAETTNISLLWSDENHTLRMGHILRLHEFVEFLGR